ncbi:SAM-dependent methyltransferase [Crocosphaera sp. XPORK-15E]|uniref:SAM-dependent methyltransferase n=1 Tax=Crocosphaera sp. XPORK-15E TaxID=3110247 RepID=UPI002B200DC0|nr:SAM-dependent methyltransferase [Crocosphaera sp. XPORK-15E]MEA5535345.1 SAM-dependent methyltransferase [Crocosphaera sp. XPORK-15E]
MNKTKSRTKIEYGDFQTPLILTEKICHKLISLGISPELIIEPTCGIGNFIKSANKIFNNSQKIIGIDLNKNYIEQLSNDLNSNNKITIIHDNFFEIDLNQIILKSNPKILIIGNFPWVTNSQQGSIKGLNLPEKNNFQAHNGLDAITGNSNFDISEWMLIKCANFLQNYHGYLAMLCKTSVARKLLNYLSKNNYYLSSCATYGIDTKKYFDATVEACLLLCQFEPGIKNYICDVFTNLDTEKYEQIGYYHNRLIRDLTTFEKFKYLYTNKPQIKWRSGVKHDCSKIMEFRKIGKMFINGLGELIELEDTYIFPLLKGSNIANGEIGKTQKYVLVTQKFIGEDTINIKKIAPLTWYYLESHASHLDKRQSKIYQKSPRFSIFGVGDYSFSPWKIAISGLYKKLEFRLIHPLDTKPVMFDDTVYFLSFKNQESAKKMLDFLTSSDVIDFYTSLIFWDEKRPIKSSILNCLNLRNF